MKTEIRRRFAALTCWWVGDHDPVRRALGGFRCSRCAKPSATMATRYCSGEVAHVRRIFGREHGGTLTRTSSWEPTVRGW